MGNYLSKPISASESVLQLLTVGTCQKVHSAEMKGARRKLTVVSQLTSSSPDDIPWKCEEGMTCVSLPFFLVPQDCKPSPSLSYPVVETDEGEDSQVTHHYQLFRGLLSVLSQRDRAPDLAPRQPRVPSFFPCRYSSVSFDHGGVCQRNPELLKDLLREHRPLFFFVEKATLAEQFGLLSPPHPQPAALVTSSGSPPPQCFQAVF